MDIEISLPITCNTPQMVKELADARVSGENAPPFNDEWLDKSVTNRTTFYSIGAASAMINEDNVKPSKKYSWIASDGETYFVKMPILELKELIRVKLREYHEYRQKESADFAKDSILRDSSESDKLSAPGKNDTNGDQGSGLLQ